MNNSIIDYASIKFKLLVDTNSFKNNWHLYSSYWKDIQRHLPDGSRICPQCGLILKRRFKSHLLSHNIQPQTWYNMLFNIQDIPICLTCKKHHAQFFDKSFSYSLYCCKECANQSLIRKEQASTRLKQYNETYGVSSCPKRWSDEQIKNRGYTGRDDLQYIQYVEKKQPTKIKPIKSKTKIIQEKKVKLYISRNPEKWTDEYIVSVGYSGRNDLQFLALLEEKRQQRKMSASKAGKANQLKNGSMLSPGSWTDEQIKNRGYTGRDDPQYIALCNQKKENCSKAGKENVKKYGFFGAPGSWTDEQIKNRGYTGRDDLRYIEKCKQKTEQSKRCGHITQKQHACKLPGRGYKIDFIYDNHIFHLDSLNELWFMLFMLNTMPNEMLLDNQHYYENTTDKFNGSGARSDIRTININSNIITNWEIHDKTDHDGIDRKKFCTELHNERFQLITFCEVKTYMNILKSIGYDVNAIHLDIKNYNYNFHKPYKFIYQKNIT